MTTSANDVNQELSYWRGVAEKLQKTADELEIRNVVSNVYLQSDHEPDLDLYGRNFTEDAVWERVDGGVAGSHIGTRVVGRDQILADRKQLREAKLAGPASSIRHLITTVAVTIGEGGTARAHSKFLVVNGAKPRPIIDAVGLYDDSFRHTDDGWKLCHRRYSSMSAKY